MHFKAKLFDLLHASGQVEIYNANAELIGLNEGYAPVGDSVRLYIDDTEWDLPDREVEIKDGWCATKDEDGNLVLLRIMVCRPITAADLVQEGPPCT